MIDPASMPLPSTRETWPPDSVMEVEWEVAGPGNLQSIVEQAMDVLRPFDLRQLGLGPRELEIDLRVESFLRAPSHTIGDSRNQTGRLHGQPSGPRWGELWRTPA